VDGTRWRHKLWLQVKLTEGLLVLGEILAEDVPERLGLLRAKVDGAFVGDGDLVGLFLLQSAEDELEIPDAHLDLDAVCVDLAVALFT